MNKRLEIYKSFGVRLENRFIIYETSNKKVAIPYHHIAYLNLSGENLVIQTDSMERLTINLNDKETAEKLFEDILIFIERLHIK